MTLKQSQGQVRRWKKVSKKVKSKMMSETVQQRWKRLTTRQKREYALKLVAFRKGKKLSSFHKDLSTDDGVVE